MSVSGCVNVPTSRIVPYEDRSDPLPGARLHLRGQLRRYGAARAVLRVLDVPVDALVFGRVLGHPVRLGQAALMAIGVILACLLFERCRNGQAEA